MSDRKTERRIKSIDKIFYDVAYTIMKCRTKEQFEVAAILIEEVPRLSLLDRMYLRSYLAERKEEWLH